LLARELAVARGLPTARLRPRAATGPAALFGVLAFASAGTAQDYLGLGGVVALAVIALVAGQPAMIVAGRLLQRLSTRTVTIAAVVLLAVAAVVFAAVYPHANVHATSVGSDRDEDADIATRRLLHLEYPYHAHTYLGNAITHMPGSILLAVPFVLIGWSALQNLFWLPVFYVGMRRIYGDARAALLATALVLVTPAVLREFVTGGDLISNSIYVLLLTLTTLRLSPSRPLARLVAAGALGVALSSRANFVFAVPLLAIAVAHEDGVREAARIVAVIVATFTAVTLPFYLADPRGFTPRRTADKLSQFNDVLPHAAHVTVGIALVVTAALCFTRMGRSGVELCRNAAVVQAVLVAVPVVLASIRHGRPDFSFLVSGYGIPVVFFAVVAAWPLLERAGGPAAEARP
jgi:hypothetical protein